MILLILSKFLFKDENPFLFWPYFDLRFFDLSLLIRPDTRSQGRRLYEK